jgi:hypothetical protein
MAYRPGGMQRSITSGGAPLDSRAFLCRMPHISSSARCTLRYLIRRRSSGGRVKAYKEGAHERDRD